MAERRTMNISLTPELESFIHAQVSTGRFASASEVVRHALRLVEEEDRRSYIERWLLGQLRDDEKKRLPRHVRDRARKLVDERLRSGLDQLARGEGIPGPDVIDELRGRING